MQAEAMQPNGLPQIQKGLSKNEVRQLVNQSVETILENGNAAQVAEVLAVLDDFVAGVRRNERFVQQVRDELLKNSGSLQTASGATIEACEAGVTYDYAQNGSWCHITGQINKLLAQRKTLEAQLRSIPADKITVDKDTGEVFFGALKSSRSTYRITLSN